MADPRDDRWVVAGGPASVEAVELMAHVRERYPALGELEARLVYSSVHDVLEVRAGTDRYALKVYRAGVRSREEVQWEVDLHRHLLDSGCPVARVIPGSRGFVETLVVGDVPRMAILSEWAAGAKPAPSKETYRLLGRAAAMIHTAADRFENSYVKEPHDLRTEVHRELARLRPALEAIDRWDEVAALGDLLGHLASPTLERGICHNDLTLDNIHVDREGIKVFDFDSAAEHWRASEAQGVYHFSVLSGGPWWASWLGGYLEERPMAIEDQRAVPYFVLMFQFENTSWKMGLAPTSLGQVIRPDELGGLVDQWSAWANQHCAET